MAIKTTQTRKKPTIVAITQKKTGFSTPPGGNNSLKIFPNKLASDVAITNPINEAAVGIAPMLRQRTTPDASTSRANSQIIIPLIKTIFKKMHAENARLLTAQHIAALQVLSVTKVLPIGSLYRPCFE